MRSLLVLALAIAAGCTYTPATAADLPDASSDATPDESPPDARIGLITLTDGSPTAPPPGKTAVRMLYNTSIVPTPGLTVACNSGAPARDNAWYRLFQASDFGIAQNVTITNVVFAADRVEADIPITVKIYDYAGVQEGAELSPPAAQMDSMADVPPTASYPAMLSAKVAAIVTPPQVFLVRIAATDDDATGRVFHLGANTAGQTAKGYYESNACGISPPGDEPATDLIIVVDGYF